ncbi:MAG: MaoC/PaaZ C-terminal domain-containing protein [Steroidobacteraceae bacterium]
MSGDVNPIHLADVTARAFGFKAAIAHGMWSLARCAAELDAALPADGARALEVAFKLPILLPAWVLLQSWPVTGGVGFALRDSQGERPHLEGSLTAAA